MNRVRCPAAVIITQHAEMDLAFAIIVNIGPRVMHVNVVDLEATAMPLQSMICAVRVIVMGTAMKHMAHATFKLVNASVKRIQKV